MNATDVKTEVVAEAQTLEVRLNTALAGMSRMGLWLLIAIAMLGVVYWLAPQMVKVSLYKLSLLPAATWVLYWIDRALNGRRPHEFFDEAAALRSDTEDAKMPPSVKAARYDKAMSLEAQGHDRYLRRTILIAAGMIAVALGS